VTEGGRSRLVATSLVAGRATGPVLALAQPLSLWGGVDPATGLIVEPRHPDHGRSIVGRILAMPASRGSSSSSSVLAELLRGGVGPLGIVLGEPDEILVVGAVVARELYGVDCPVMLLGRDDYAIVAAWRAATIHPDGTITRGAVRPAIS
jgi:predicted aconitase with swiveling domain